MRTISFPLEVAGRDDADSRERIVELSRALGIEETLHRGGGRGAHRYRGVPRRGDTQLADQQAEAGFRRIDPVKR